MGTESKDPSTKNDSGDNPATTALLEKMKATKAQWDAETASSPDGPDETDALLSQAISMAIEQGKGWAPGEREKYLETLLDDDFIPPLFATSAEELENSGLAEAFTTLHDEGETPARNMLDCKQRGNDAVSMGKKNVAKNLQYYREAVNHYYEAYHWANRVRTVEEDFVPTPEELNAADDEPFFTLKELDEMRSVICANCALAHMMLKNWGHVRDEAKKAVDSNPENVKAWYRLAKAHQMLQNWEEAGNAIDAGLAVPAISKTQTKTASTPKPNKELLALQTQLATRIRKARLLRQQRERARAERISNIKQVWKYCKNEGIGLGRVSLVATVKDDEDDGGDGNTSSVTNGAGGEAMEHRWHFHYPHTGRLPQIHQGSSSSWTWPVLFVYPSHHQSDFIEFFGEDEMIALRMAQMFPEYEGDDDGQNETPPQGYETEMPWDYNNEFRCSNLVVYFEVHCVDNNNKNDKDPTIHPDSVEKLKDLGSTMKFYESSRALKGDEGPEMAKVARCLERKHLHRQRKQWIKHHGSLWCKPDPCPVMQVHPAATLGCILRDKSVVVPNFLVTFILFPLDHPAHKEFLKEHKCMGIVEPKKGSD